MSKGRIVLIVASCLVLVLLAGGGVALRVGAADGSYRDVVLFSEVLSLITDNYVDAVDSEGLLEGAYDGMLSSLDPNGAFLSPEEVRQWKRPDKGSADPGIIGVKMHGSLSVVFVARDSPAEDAGIVPGDQIRQIGERPVRSLSQEQARRMLRGEPGSSVRIEVLHPMDDFAREELDLQRVPRAYAPYELKVVEGVALLEMRDLARLDVDALAEELDDVRSRKIERLLVDLRVASEGSPRDAARVVEMFATGPLFRLTDRSGRAVETIDAKRSEPVWSGKVGILVNSLTAGGAEGAALALKSTRDAAVYGETTYGLGAEPELFELPDGSGLIFPTGIWETASGDRWNGTGIEPDHPLRIEGTELREIEEERLRQALEAFSEDETSDERPQKEAA
jgi:carboxyl-terminal processing protease